MEEAVNTESVQKVDIREIASRTNPQPAKPAFTEADNDFMALVRQRNAERYQQQEQQQATEAVVEEQQPSLLDNKFEVPGIPKVDIEEPLVEEDEVPDVAEEDAEPVEEDPLEKKRRNKAENLKNLRNALKSSKDRVSELELQIEAKDRELEKLAEIDSLKEQLQEKEERLQKLKQYEDVVSLYGTEGFKEKFYDSVDELRLRAEDVASDYGVPAGVLDAAFKMTNQRQLNEYLGRYFDTFAVQDIRGYIKEAQQIIADRERAEAEPAKARELLLTTIAKRREAERIQSRENLKSAGMSAWSDMAAAYGNKDSGVALLQEKQGNKSHNELKDTILSSACTEFGKTLAVLADNGLKDLPAGVARAMASRYQLGEAAAHAIVQAENLHKENMELKAELKKFTEYQRPLGSGKASVSGTNTSEKDLKGKDLARYIYNKAESSIAR